MKQDGMERKASKYIPIAEKEHVLVKVPGPDCEYMKIVPAHSFTTCGGTEVQVKEHWRHGQLVGNRVGEYKDGKPVKNIVTRHFFGITQDDLGRKIIATVKVVVKKVVDPTTGNEKEYIMLNITKEPDCTWPDCKMVIAEQRTKGAGDIYIKGSRYYLSFKPLPSKEKIETAQHGHAEQTADQPAATD